mmetsp:Transcript_37648/g.55473  ORF Transcript_37648/g.55473 Transcript_37648/m.55473 type:complete len:358 (+) Transcript_37648:4026-5099(+)
MNHNLHLNHKKKLPPQSKDGYLSCLSELSLDPSDTTLPTGNIINNSISFSTTSIGGFDLMGSGSGGATITNASGAIGGTELQTSGEAIGRPLPLVRGTSDGSVSQFTSQFDITTNSSLPLTETQTLDSLGLRSDFMSSAAARHVSGSNTTNSSWMGSELRMSSQSSIESEYNLGASLTPIGGFNLETFLDGILDESGNEDMDEEEDQGVEHDNMAGADVLAQITAQATSSNEESRRESSRLSDIFDPVLQGLNEEGGNTPSGTGAYGVPVGRTVIGKGRAGIQGSPEAGHSNIIGNAIGIPLLNPETIMASGSETGVDTIATGCGLLALSEDGGEEGEDGGFQRNSFFANLMGGGDQ